MAEGNRERLVSFLRAIDREIRHPVAIRIAGAAALVLAYRVPRTTVDIDVVESPDLVRLLPVAGRGSALHRKYGIFLQNAPAFLLRPDDWEAHLRPVRIPGLRRIRVKVLDPYDLICSKIARCSSKDIEDIRFLATRLRLRWGILLRRYRNARKYEVNPRRVDSQFLMIAAEIFGVHNLSRESLETPS